MAKFKPGDRIWYMSGGDETDVGTVVGFCGLCGDLAEPGLTTSEEAQSYVVTWDDGSIDVDESQLIGVENHACFDMEDLQFVGSPSEDKSIRFTKGG